MATKSKGGRPKKYTEEYLDHLAQDLLHYIEENRGSNREIFMLNDWCLSSGFPKWHFSRYTKQNGNFKEAYEWAKSWQEHQISKGALLGTVNSGFAQFFLSCNHHWRSKRKEDSVKPIEKTPLEYLSERMKAVI